MSKLPVVTGAELLRALKRSGFVVARRRGSHVQVRRTDPDGTITTFPVPIHAGRAIKRGTLKGILRKADLSAEDLKSLL